MDQYEKLLSNKIKAASFYNDYAWNLSGQELVTPAKDIDFIEKISKRSLRFLKEAMKRSNILTLHEKSIIFLYLKHSFKLMKDIRFDSISSEAKKQQHIETRLNKLNEIKLNNKIAFIYYFVKLFGAHF